MSTKGGPFSLHPLHDRSEHLGDVLHAADEPWYPKEVAAMDELKWPKEFEDYILQQMVDLKRKQDELLKKHQAK